jgi:hypothetical protein
MILSFITNKILKIKLFIAARDIYIYIYRYEKFIEIKHQVKLLIIYNKEHRDRENVGEKDVHS